MPDTESNSFALRSCDLCGLACGRRPYTQRVRDQERFFCCLGCMNVYLILTESVTPGTNLRETELFKRSLELGLISRTELDPTPKVQPLHEQIPTEELLLHVRGMWCTSCAWLIEYGLAKVRGVVSTEASFASDLVKVKYQPQFVPPARILERIKSLGYEASEFRLGEEEEDREKRDLLLRLGIAAFLWMNVMYLSMTLYVSFFEHVADSIRQYIPFLIWALATPVVFYCGFPILRVAWLGLRQRVIRAEALLGLGILAAYFYSIVQAFRGDPHIYFDTACVIVALVLAGKLIERNAKERASHWIALLHRMMPNKVRLMADGLERFASVEALEPGAEFVVKAGEQISADGVVVAGQSHADESLLTGESQPVRKRIGDAVVAGSVNGEGILRIRALRSVQDSTLARVVARVEQALSSRSPLQRAVDRVARIFVPTVVAIAAVLFAVLWLGGIASLGVSLMRAITVLVIACPCALGLATPLAITAAMGSSSHRGILFRDGRVLETVRRVDAVVLDKTGTITEGDFTLLDFVAYRPETLEPALVNQGTVRFSETTMRTTFKAAVSKTDRLQALSLVASLEQYSEHPLGRAVVDFARREGARFADAHFTEVIKGCGIAGIVEGKNVFAGNRRLLRDRGILLEPDSEEQAKHWQSEGKTVAFFGWDGEVQGMVAFGDRIRSDTAQLVRTLKEDGLSVYVASGDSVATTRHVASTIGADEYKAEVSPEEKAEFVQRLRAEGMVVAMVGDGINDAPALAHADVGIAMGSGADIAMKAASVVLMTGSLNKIPKVFSWSEKTVRVVRQNLFWAFCYNGAGIGLAAAGILNPILAAGAMLLSSVSVIVNSLRLTRIPQDS